MVRARTPGRDRAGVTDAAIVTTGFAVASWVFVMSPLLAQQDTLATRIVALGYPAGNVLVLAVGARLFAGHASLGGAYRLLGINLLIRLVADTSFAVLVGLHPAMPELTRRQPAAEASFG